MHNLIDRFFRFLIRVSAFLRKEIVEILRQPRLVLTLILGPFLILFLFGIGFQSQAKALRTLFVVEQGSGLEAQVQAYAGSLGEQLVFAGVTSDQNEALDRLRNGQVDVVAVIPSDAYDTIRNSQQAVITLYHYEIDPFNVDYINVFGQVYVDEINRRLLETVTSQGQTEATTIQDDLDVARESAAAMRQALEQGDAVHARWQQGRLTRHLDMASLAVGASLGLLSSTGQVMDSAESNEAQEILNTFTGVRNATDSLDLNPDDPSDFSNELEQLRTIEQDLAMLDSNLEEFRGIEPFVIVRPFRHEVRSIAAVQPDVANYYAPSVIVLLLQHLSLTFAALSIVRERRLGATELFYVAPLSPFETLLGKYLSYMIFGIVLTAILTVVLVFVLQVPMLGAWEDYSLVLVALLFASLGFGFTLSLLSQSDTQAVQYSMLVLLTSVFFSGFFLSLESFWAPIRAISWMLPATYAIALLQDIMLRGNLPSAWLLIALTIMGLFFMFVSYLLLRWLMARQ